MPLLKKKLKPRDELLATLAILLLALFAWYLALYQPVEAKINDLKDKIQAEKDSLAAISVYKAQTLVYRTKAENIGNDIKVWEERFPPRSKLVELSRSLISNCARYELKLLEITPSMFELYTLEKAGDPIAGKHIAKQPVTMRVEGRYLNFARMVDELDQLDFNITVTDIDLEVIPEKTPLLKMELRMYVYVSQEVN